MATLNDIEKLNYINNRFHQYFDFKTNKNFTTTEKINLIVPINSLYTITDYKEILNKYNDTTIEKQKVVYCNKVIDGDTIWVRDVIDYEEVENNEPIKKTFASLDDYTREEILLDEPYKVRFVGVDTPEITPKVLNPDTRTDQEKAEDEAELKKGEVAKRFIEKICLHNFIYLNIDTDYSYGEGKIGEDKYGRTLAVVIAENKNLNEVLLKENLATIMSISPSKFDPTEWEDDSAQPTLFNEYNDDLGILSSYFREDMTNVVFTPSDDTSVFYPYEVYKNVFYIKLYPYSQNIRMHILPKSYNCSNEDNVLILKDDAVKRRNTDSSTNYKIYEEKDNINAYFQENNQDRDRITITNRDYNRNNWTEDSTPKSETFVDFSYDISDLAKSFNNLEICAGYRYNNTSPYYALHYTGVKDNQGRPEDRCTLIDANVDGVKSKTSIITQMMYNDNSSPVNTEDDIIYIKHDPEVRKEIGNFDHINNIGTLHHKVLKYINDFLYVEEGEMHDLCEWIDRKQEEIFGGN